MGSHYLLLLLVNVVAADTCFTNAQFFGVIFGSIAAAFLICAAIAIVLWLCLHKTGKKAAKKTTTAAYTNTACDVEEKGCDAPPKTINKDKMTMIDSFKLKKNVTDTGTQKTLSSQHLNEVDGRVGVQLKGEDLGGLGFNIQGNMNDGIFVKSVLPKGPAEECGNIITGDRIKSITIHFENMVYEDAVTLLSYASPYRVKLELERKLEEPVVESNATGSPRLHPLFRSNTLQNIHFNPISCPAQRCGSQDTTQKHALPKTEEPSPPSESSKAPIPDSTTQGESGSDADISKLESSDDVDATSEYRDSLSEDHATGTESVASTEEISQRTLPDHIEITEIISDKLSPVASPTPPRAEFCASLPPKPRKVVSRSPSPKVVSSTTVRASPVAEKKPTTPPAKETPPTPPTPPATSSIPVRREPSKSRIPPPSPPRAPEIAEARVSRIPKRTDSVKTPVIERKLPAIPTTHRSQSAEDKRNEGDVWSRLYQEKKGALRKTRDSPSPAPSGLPSSMSPRVQRSPRSPSIENKYGTLNRERRERLTANQDILDRQKEELRQLGLL